MSFLAHCTLFFVKIVIIQKKYIDQKYSMKQFENFSLEPAQIFLKIIIFRQQGLQIAAFHQRSSKCKCETHLEGEHVPKSFSKI